MSRASDLDHLIPGQRVWKWIALVIPSLAMLGAAVAKFFPPADAGTPMPVDPVWLPRLAVLILCSLLLYWLPRTALPGVILLTGYLGGAIAFNLLVMKTSPLLPIVLGALLWVGYGLRFPSVLLAAGLIPKNK